MVRAGYGRFADAFVNGGYVAIGWLPKSSLEAVTERETLRHLYREQYPEDTSNIVVGQQVGQIARFLFELKPADLVLTPCPDSDFLYVGQVTKSGGYSYVPNDPACPYTHRRPVEWKAEKIKRSELSVPLQNTLRSSLTIFQVSQLEEILGHIGIGVEQRTTAGRAYDPVDTVLAQIMQLDAREFELLITSLLSAMGFEGQHTGRPGDGGVDATGELDMSNLAKIRVYVQAKRYQVGAKIKASTVKQLRQSIPFGGQGAFITTADYQADAYDVALADGFPRIGLINGRQLVDLLVQNWDRLEPEFKERLGLKPGLILA